MAQIKDIAILKDFKIALLVQKLHQFCRFAKTKNIFNRAGVAGAVSQTPSQLINSVGRLVILLFKYLQNIITPKPYELGT